MAESVREVQPTVVREVSAGVVSVPKDRTYVAFKPRSILSTIYSLGRRRPLEGLEVTIPEVRDYSAVFYAMGHAQRVAGEIKDKLLEVTTKLRKVGERGFKSNDGSLVMENVYRKEIEVVDADSHWGPLRRKFKVVEILNGDKETLDIERFSIKALKGPTK